MADGPNKAYVRLRSETMTMIASQQLSTPPFAVGAPREEPLLVTRWPAMGATCEIQFPASAGERGQTYAETAIQWTADFEARYSRFRADSVVSQINASAGGDWVAIDEDMERVLDVCATLHSLTRGVIDVTTLPIQRLWEVRAGVPQVPTRDQVQAALSLVGWTKVERRPGWIRLPLAGMGIDLGGWGREYAVDALIELARQSGLGCVLVSCGRDVRVLGTPPGRAGWPVGLDDPERPGNQRGSLALIDRAVASTFDGVRSPLVSGGRLIDPRTGLPVANGCRQVSVIASTCLQAGLFSTTAFILGARDGMRAIEEALSVEGCLRTAEGVQLSKGFPGYLISPP